MSFNTKFSKRFNQHFMHDKRIGVTPKSTFQMTEMRLSTDI